jgi:dTDP-4-dehydrorhamnose reductase
VILVFGGQGQLGSELASRAREKGVALAALGHGEVDVADPRTIALAVARHHPALIVNAAAFNNVDKAERQMSAAHRTNALGPSVVATAAKRAGVPVIHVSTDYVFDGEKTGPYNEDDAIGPLNVYGRTKATGEDGVRNAHPHHLILRTSRLFGIHGANFLKTVVKQAQEEGTLRYDAAQRSAPTFAADLADAILSAAAGMVKDAVSWGTYHVAGAEPATRHSLATAIVAAQAKFTGKMPAIEVVPPLGPPAAARRPVNSVLDSSRFANAFGYVPGDWREAVEKAVRLLFAHGGAG